MEERRERIAKRTRPPPAKRRDQEKTAPKSAPADDGDTPAPALPSDALDRAIIGMLQEDGRLSFVTIARALEVSEGTVRNRVNRMIEAKVLRIIAVADPLALGYEAYAMLGLKLAPGCDPESAAERFRRRPEVTYVLFVAARYDLLVEVICETHDDLRGFLLEHCYGHPDIASVEPMIGLAMYKNLLKWGRP